MHTYTKQKNDVRCTQNNKWKTQKRYLPTRTFSMQYVNEEATFPTVRQGSQNSQVEVHGAQSLKSQSSANWCTYIYLLPNGEDPRTNQSCNMCTHISHWSLGTCTFGQCTLHMHVEAHESATFEMVADNTKETHILGLLYRGQNWLTTSQQKTCFQKVYVFVLSSKPNNGFFNSKMSIRAHSVQCKEGQDLLREEFEEIGHYTLNRSLSGMNLKVPPQRIPMVCDREAAGISWVLFQMASDVEAKKNWFYFYYPYFLGYRQKMGFSSWKQRLLPAETRSFKFPATIPLMYVIIYLSSSKFVSPTFALIVCRALLA